MRLSETAGSALEALARNRLRSVLTTLGVIIGVFSVITIVAVGTGARHMVQDSLKSFGADMLFVVPGQHKMGPPRGDQGAINTMMPEDARAVERECPDVKWVSAVTVSSAALVYGNQNWSCVVSGQGPLFPKVRDWPLERGSFFTDYDVDQNAKVCVLGHTVVTKLFGRAEDPVGRTIRVKKMPFRVVGVLASKGQTGWGQDQDDLIVAPYTTVMKRLAGVTYLSAMQCTAWTSNRMDAARKQLTEVLRRRHRLVETAEADFSIITADEILDMVNQIYDMLILFLGSVASIALLVGGIGIMNIMLVSVAERIREIGIRLAVGARGRDILLQFLLEAVLLSTAGGVLGLAAGAGMAQLISVVLKWPVLIDPASSIGAVVFSSAVGIIFGFYPAWRASRLDPITALRHD